jgi:hypothetical protein
MAAVLVAATFGALVGITFAALDGDIRSLRRGEGGN